jgi:hypothetical protein
MSRPPRLTDRIPGPTDEPQLRPAVPARDPGVEANARLTATTGVILLLLLAAEGVTILSIRSLLPEHFFIGFLLIPPVLLKIGSTGYRFARYYTGDQRYRRAGPPALPLRLLGPVMVLSTIALFASGVEVWWFGFRFGTYWLTLHKLSFVIWFGATSLHVLGHLERTPRLVWKDLFGADRASGRITRGSLVMAALLLGLVLAVATAGFSTPFVIPLEQ